MKLAAFKGSKDYWEQRYRRGGNSGAGSYNRLASFKADFLNDFVSKHNIKTVAELGSGDGAQLALANYPSYVGVDVSRTAVEHTRMLFAGRDEFRFLHSSEVSNLRAELSLSLDVIYHLVEESVYEAYMRQLFDIADRYVIVYASNHEGPSPAPHVRHRRFTDWVKRNRPDFALNQVLPNAYPADSADPGNTSFADFHVFAKLSSVAPLVFR